MTSAWVVDLERSLDGRVIRAGEEDMVLSRKQFAARLPFEEPELLIRCASAADVARSIRVLGQAGVGFALRSGGHCFGDRSNAAGVIVDMAELDSVAVTGETATFGAGVTASAAVDALAAHSRAIPTGGCVGVAVSGLAMAGGFGYSGRRLGFLADRVRGFDAVLADGREVRVDAEIEPDLFWALRGAGAGLAAVTALTVATAPAVGGLALRGEWPLTHAAELIDRWQRWAPYADPAMNVELTLWTSDFPDVPCTIRLHGGTTGGDLGELRTALGGFADDIEAVLHSPTNIAAHFVGRLDHRGETAWQPSFPYRDVGFQATRSHFLHRSATASTLAALVAQAAADRRYAQAREVELIPWGGAYARPAAPACIAHRDAAVLVRHTVMAGARSKPDDRAAAMAWVEASHAVLADEATGAYAGYAEPDRLRWRAAAFGGLQDRLKAIKRRYDPEGLLGR